MKTLRKAFFFLILISFLGPRTLLFLRDFASIIFSPSDSSPKFTLLSYANDGSCGSYRVAGIPTTLTIRHCEDPFATIRSNLYFDSPIQKYVGLPIDLPKPQIGPAIVYGYHFGKTAKIEVNIIAIDQCQAKFIIKSQQELQNSYIQSGDSGSPIVQLQPDGTELVVGSLSAGIPRAEAYPLEGGRAAFVAGVSNYKDCLPKKN
ncbi:MAG: hypothetical protein ACRCXZ_00680 [Patescibacteria group bacterium]